MSDLDHPHLSPLRETEPGADGPDVAAAERCRELRGQTASLLGWSATCEADLLVVGRELADSHARIRQALDAMEQLGQAILDERGSGAVRSLGDSASQLLALDGLHARALCELETLHLGVGQTRIGADAIGRSLRQLTHLGIIVRTNVNTSRVTLEALGGFAEEVTELIAGGYATSLELSTRLLSVARGLNATDAGRHRAEAGSQAAELAAQLRTLRDAMSDHRAATQRAFDRSRERFAAVWSAVGGVVVGLQFHDIARQRLEHSVAGVERLFGLIERGRLSDDGERLPDERRAIACHRIIGIETAQLEALATDCEHEFDQLRSSLGGIATNLATAQELFLAIHHGAGENVRQPPGSPSAPGVLAQLENELGGVQKLIATGQAARGALRDALSGCVREAEPLGELAARLADFEQDLRLSGLNAVIRSSKIEGGNEAIRCISQELREGSAAVKREAGELRAGLAKVVAAARSLAQDILPAIESTEAALSADLARSTLILQELDRTGRAAHGLATRAADGLADRLAELGRRPASERDGIGIMRAVAATLRELRLDVPAADRQSAAWPELESLLQARYTMASERQVHTGQQDQMAPDMKMAAAEVAAADDLSDILF